MVHSKRKLNQLTGKSRKLSKAVLPFFTILLLEEVTTPASVEALYSHFHFVPPVGLRTKIDPFCKSYKFVANAVKDELFLARLQFFNYLASMFESFLKLYQADTPMLPHMNGDLLELIKNILRMFIKSEAIEACSNLTKIDLHNKEIWLKLSQIDIGFGAEKSSN